MARACSMKECSKRVVGFNYCDMHYRRFKKHGDANIVKGTGSHNRSRTPEYVAWSSMKDRCYRKNAVEYENYGGRGITICNEWLNSFASFYTDMGDKPTPQHSLDRIDNDKGYSPGNCRWASKTEQVLNRRISKRNKTGHKGVVIINDHTWGASIVINYKHINLGQYRSLEDAINARKNGEIKYRGLGNG